MLFVLQVAPNLSYLLVSVDASKVSLFAHSLQPDRLRANEWVTAALQDLPGARGGGKANTAQGSASVESVTMATEAVRGIQQAATTFTSQLGL